MAFCCCSVTKLCQTLQPHGLQHARLPCLLPYSRGCSNMSIESVMPSNHLIFCHPPLLLPSVFPNIKVFSNELALCIRWPKYWSFSTSSSNEYSGLISFGIDWFELPTPVFLPGESQGQRSLVGCRLRGRTESDTTEAT